MLSRRYVVLATAFTPVSATDSSLQEVEIDFGELVSKNLARPLRILFTEPIVLLVSKCATCSARELQVY